MTVPRGEEYTPYAEPAPKPTPLLTRLSLASLGVALLAIVAVSLIGRIPPTSPSRCHRAE